MSSNGGTTWTDVVQGTATAWSLVDPTTHATYFTSVSRIVNPAPNLATTASQAVTIDTTAPAEALAITAIATDSGTVGDFITSDTTLTVSGTNGALAAGDKRQISSNCGTTWTAAVQGTATAWSLVDPTTHATSFTYQARIIDSFPTRRSSDLQAVTIDTTAPAEALAITAIATDSGTVGDFITSDTTLTVSGTNGALAAGDEDQITSNDGTHKTAAVQGTATACTRADPITHATR